MQREQLVGYVEVTDYVATIQLGHRLPHPWLADGRSSLDALGEWFTLFTPDPARWGQQGASPWPVHIEVPVRIRTDTLNLPLPV